MKKVPMFDDQHQPMSSWLEKLANDEASNFTGEDLKDDAIPVKQAATYTGISSTWNKKSAVDSTPVPILDDSSRHIDNKPIALTSVDVIEKSARKLMMSGLSLEKTASILKKKYDKNELKAFDLSKLELEYGRLGHIYVDASLVDNCNDLSELLKNASNLSSIAIRDVKKTAKCDDCNFNKSCHCVKLGLNITDNSIIKSAQEAKFVLNKFASLKYINSYFIKSSDITKYYSRLASDNPDKVVSEFLIDVNNKRTAEDQIINRGAAKINDRVAAKIIVGDIKNKNVSIKFGRDDVEMSNSFKQSLLNNRSIRTAKSELSKKYSSDRIDAFLKEARDDLKRYINFLNTKSLTSNSRDATSNELIARKIENTLSKTAVDNAIKIAYSLKTLRQSNDLIKSTVAKTFGNEVANHVISKLAVDKEAQMLGLTYIDSNLYSHASELQSIAPIIMRRANNMILQIKEGPLCKLANNPNGICPITGLKIVKNASIESRRQATRVIEHAKNIKLTNSFEIDRVAAKLKDDNNSDTIRLFLTAATKRSKQISSGLVKQITDVALKYAKDISFVRRVASASWLSVNSLVNILEKHVANKTAFIDDIKKVVNKSANDANVYLNPINQYNVDVFSPDKDNVSDVVLGKTI